jgi:opacity protein-like surface antigen
LYNRFTVDLQSEIGFQPVSDRTSWSWGVMVGGTWRPMENVGVRLGYRQLLFDLKNGADADEFKFRGGMAGLFAGIELRF